MKRTALARRTPLKRAAPLKRAPRWPKRQAVISPATPQQRARVGDLACLVCAQGPPAPAHLIDRSLAPEWGDDPRIVVPLCPLHHRAYDDHEIDLSPYLEPRWRESVACAVEAVGLFSALKRITGREWVELERAA